MGAMFDSNIKQTRANRVSGAGSRIVPSLIATAGDGIHKTTFYGALDGRFYFNGSPTDSNSVAARAGLSHTYEAMTDLVFKVNGDYTRQKDLFDGFRIDRGTTNLNTTGVGLIPVANPQSYNQFAGSASVHKDLGRAFVTFTGSVVDVVYDSAGSPAPNGVVYTATGRVGQWLGPSLFVFGEASADQRSYVTATLSSHGYRTVGGLGSDQIGLFRGEIYGGYQAELYDFAAISNIDSAAFGARLYYHPTHALTLLASVDRSLGVSQSATSPTSPFGTATRVTTSVLRATYAVSSEWSASARAGYIQSEYVASRQRDDAWMTGATITYSLWRNLNLTLDYQFFQKSSNDWVQNFTRNVITLGASYKY